MKLAKYWARASSDTLYNKHQITARGWSEVSFEAACEDAKQRAERLVQRLLQGATDARRYVYGDRPLPEPVLEELNGTNASAVVTRNSYGAMILNTQKLFISDIDDSSSQSTPGIFGWLFGTRSRTRADEIVSNLKSRGVKNFRLYRTAQGYRAIVLDDLIDPASTKSEDLHKAVGADPAYRHLCKLQQSFRARLTPKPWRIGESNPPSSFPFMTNEEESRFEMWRQNYTKLCEGYATCKLVEVINDGYPIKGVDQILQYHDRLCKVDSDLPLA